MQLLHRAARHYTTDRPLDCNPPLGFQLVLAAFNSWRQLQPLFLIVFLFSRSASLPFFFMHFRSRAYCIRFFTALPSISRRRPWMPLNFEHPDAFRSRSARHPCGDPGAPQSTLPVSSTGGLPPIPRVAAFYPKMEPQHPSLSTATLVAAGTNTPHTHARLDPYMARTRPSDVRDSCNTVVLYGS